MSAVEDARGDVTSDGDFHFGAELKLTLATARAEFHHQEASKILSLFDGSVRYCRGQYWVEPE